MCFLFVSSPAVNAFFAKTLFHFLYALSFFQKKCHKTNWLCFITDRRSDLFKRNAAFPINFIPFPIGVMIYLKETGLSLSALFLFLMETWQHFFLYHVAYKKYSVAYKLYPIAYGKYRVSYGICFIACAKCSIAHAPSLFWHERCSGTNWVCVAARAKKMDTTGESWSRKTKAWCCR